MSIHFCSDASEFLRHLDRWIHDVANVAFLFASAFSQRGALDYNCTQNPISLFPYRVNDSLLFGLVLLVFAQQFILLAFACEKILTRSDFLSQ
jgi:FtsH-binding integral membrane protein